MSTLSSELRAVIEGRLKVATLGEILAIASTLCGQENGAPRVERPATPGVRFAVDGDVVKDSTTGLIWTRKTIGSFKWAAAKEACAKDRTGGFEDWRLPSIQELLTLVDYGRHDPAIDPAFECEANWYWTSTVPAASPSGYAWVVVFSSGGSYWGSRSSESRVRAVRAGQIVGSLA